MNYPKDIMTRKALITMGFSEAYLMRAFTTPGQTFAWRENPLNKHSPINLIRRVSKNGDLRIARCKNERGQ